jgi:hypothetical protein
MIFNVEGVWEDKGVRRSVRRSVMREEMLAGWRRFGFLDYGGGRGRGI